MSLPGAARQSVTTARPQVMGMIDARVKPGTAMK